MKEKKQEEEPLIMFFNPETGISVWPVMKQDSEGNWVFSYPEEVKSLLGVQEPKSGKK